MVLMSLVNAQMRGHYLRKLFPRLRVFPHALRAMAPTLPAAADKVGASCADVHVHRTGRFLYGSNRGHDSIVIYRLGDDGRMTLVGHESRNIKRPRNFTIDPTGTLMLVANQDAANVTIFRIDQNKGTLEPVGKPTPVGINPSFVGVVMLSGR